MFWTHDLQLKQDLTVHFRKGNVDEPFDPGSIIDTKIPGQISAPFCWQMVALSPSSSTAVGRER